MCLAFPGIILSIEGDQAITDFDGVQKSVNVSLLEAPKKGDYIIVHAGFAIQKLGKEDAFEVLRLFEEARGK